MKKERTPAEKVVRIGKIRTRTLVAGILTVPISIPLILFVLKKLETVSDSFEIGSDYSVILLTVLLFTSVGLFMYFWAKYSTTNHAAGTVIVEEMIGPIYEERYDAPQKRFRYSVEIRTVRLMLGGKKDEVSHLISLFRTSNMEVLEYYNSIEKRGGGAVVLPSAGVAGYVPKNTSKYTRRRLDFDLSEYKLDSVFGELEFEEVYEISNKEFELHPEAKRRMKLFRLELFKFEKYTVAKRKGYEVKTKLVEFLINILEDIELAYPNSAINVYFVSKYYDVNRQSFFKEKLDKSQEQDFITITIDEAPPVIKLGGTLKPEEVEAYVEACVELPVVLESVILKNLELYRGKL